MFKKLHGNTLFTSCFLLAILLGTLWARPGIAAPSADLWPIWQKNTESSSKTIDHSPWKAILDTYVVVDHPSAINRFKYGTVTAEDQQSLTSYLTLLQQTKVTQLRRKEQKAFWINLYNALTVKVILDHYPVKSIMDIDISPGFFSNGPWDAKLLHIEGKELSLNDIEHRILRPIFTDNRVHYALNCASLGCPNLQPEPFTADNTERLLNKGANSYINHPRGVALRDDGKVQVSSIYKWFKADFGGSDPKVIAHLLLYAQDDLAQALKTYKKRLSFDYDWNLNE